MCPQFLAYLLNVKEELFEGFLFGGAVFVSSSLDPFNSGSFDLNSGSLGLLRRGGELLTGVSLVLFHRKKRV